MDAAVMVLLSLATASPIRGRNMTKISVYYCTCIDPSIRTPPPLAKGWGMKSVVSSLELYHTVGNLHRQVFNLAIFTEFAKSQNNNLTKVFRYYNTVHLFPFISKILIKLPPPPIKRILEEGGRCLINN